MNKFNLSVLLTIFFGAGMLFVLGQKLYSSCSAINLTTRESERRSLGEKILVTAEENSQKEAVVKAFSDCNFEKAKSQFSPPLNDPEAWIYQNNAGVVNQPNFKIVVSVPIGSNQAVAQEILRGVALAQYEVNNSLSENNGINGKGLLVEIADDKDTPETAKQLANEFVKDSSILAVIGHNSGDASLAALPVYHRGGLVMITPTSSTANLSVISKYVFRTTLNTNVIAKKIADYVTAKSLKKVVICVDSQDSDGKSFLLELKNLIGDRIANLECDLDSNKLDANPKEFVSQATKKQAEAMLLFPSVKAIERVIGVAKANTIQGRPLPLLGGDSIYQPDTLKKGAVNVEGMVLAVAWHRESGQDFLTKNENFFGTPYINWRTAMAYDATKVIIKGLKQANTREGLQQVLANPGFSVIGATEIIKFDPAGERQGTPKLLTIKSQADSPTGYAFVTLPSSE